MKTLLKKEHAPITKLKGKKVRVDKSFKILILKKALLSSLLITSGCTKTCGPRKPRYEVEKQPPTQRARPNHETEIEQNEAESGVKPLSKKVVEDIDACETLVETIKAKLEIIDIM